MSPMMSGKVRQNQRPFECYFDGRSRTIAKFQLNNLFTWIIGHRSLYAPTVMLTNTSNHDEVHWAISDLTQYLAASYGT